METAVATPARPSADATVAFPLRDVDDLHDADLDGVLADQLAYGVSAAQAADAAATLAELIGATAPAALAAHDLSQAAGTFAA